MRVLAFLPVAVSAVASTTADVDQMRDTFKSLAGKKIDDATRTVVGQMLTSIRQNLSPALEEDRRLAQKTVDDSLAVVNSCKTTREGEFSGQISSKGTSKDAARATHLTCRGPPPSLLQNVGVGLLQDHPQEYGYNVSRHWSDYDTDESHAADFDAAAHGGVVAETNNEKHSYDTMNTDCTSLNTWVHGFSVQAQDASCTDSDNVHSWFRFMDTFESDNAATYKSRRTACHEARHNHQHRFTQCNRDQADFEAKTCSWCSAIDTACGEYGACFGRDNSSYTQDIGTVKDLENIFKKQMHALECLLCYGDQILANEADLSVCDSNPCQNCTQLDITYPAPHDQIACDEACPNRPCDAEWNSDEYSVYTGSNTPVATCTTCPV